MAADTYSAKALVLRKTKLGETDNIVTFMAEDGSQLRAVAKGARKPNSSFASRLELFSEVDVLLVRGKSLDIVKEAKLTDAHMGVRGDMEHAAACAPIIDVLYRLTQPDLTSPRLYGLASSALAHEECSNSPTSLALCAAFMLKSFAFSGFRPNFTHCVLCGKPAASALSRERIMFSPAEGGAVCKNCLSFNDAIQVPADVLAWAHWLMMATFDEVCEKDVPMSTSFEVLDLCQAWVSEHVGSRLKSLEFLKTCGLF